MKFFLKFYPLMIMSLLLTGCFYYDPDAFTTTETEPAASYPDSELYTAGSDFFRYFADYPFSKPKNHIPCSDGSKFVLGFNPSEDDGIHSDNVYPAGTGLIQADFAALDTTHEYYTDFEFFFQKLVDNKWVDVMPLGPLVECNATSDEHNMKIYPLNSNGRIFVQMDLAWYPLQESGTYRIVKPFYEGETDTPYEAYYEFKLADTKPSDSVYPRLYLSQMYYSSSPDFLVLKLTTLHQDDFALSHYFDIERKEGDKWVSTRSGSVYCNSIGAGYAIPLCSSLLLSTSRFSIDTPGHYRVRLSVEKVGLDDEGQTDWTNTYKTIYLPFIISS